MFLLKVMEGHSSQPTLKQTQQTCRRHVLVHNYLETLFVFCFLPTAMTVKQVQNQPVLYFSIVLNLIVLLAMLHGM